MSQLIPIARTTGQRRASVVFVHGLGGHPYGTWQAAGKDAAGQPLYWPVWLAQDLPGVDVYTIGYDASASGWTGQTMAIEDRADNICELLLGQETLADAPVFFLCHSLGGIILKRVMLRLKERAPHEPNAARLFAAIRKLGFLATPHTGSDKAGLMDRFRMLVWPTVLTRALVDNAATLRQVNISYRVLAAERQDSLRHKVLFETRSTALGRIVREAPSDPGLIDTHPVGIDGDHITLVKPKSREALAYRSLVDFLRKDVAPDDDAPPVILQRPPYEQHAQIDLMGVLGRVVALAGLVALGWFLWPRAAVDIVEGQADVVKIIYGVAAIEEPAKRVTVAERLLGRSLSEKERFLVEKLQLTADGAQKVDADRINALAETGSPEQLRRAVARIAISRCKNTQGFEIADNRLRCIGGVFVPFVGTPNTSGPIQSLKALVFHFTATNDASMTIHNFAEGKFQASTHILVDRSGGIVQMVPFDTIAWHAGVSSYPPLGLLGGLNPHSIAVDLINLGKLEKQADGSFKSWSGQAVAPEEVLEVTADGETTGWHRYTPEQIAAATAIAKAFRAEKPGIALLGHSDVAPGRKIDPGPAFPLARIARDAG